MLCILENHEKKACVSLKSVASKQQSNLCEISICDFAQNIYAYKENGEIISFICDAAVSANGKNGHYLFGGATAPSFQKQGYFTKVLQFAQASLNEDFIFILQNKHENYYKNLGFKDAFAMRKINATIKRNLWAVAEFDTITAKKLAQLRQIYLSDNYIFAKNANAIITGLYSQGITTAATDNAYALYYREQETLEIVELNAKTDDDAQYLLEAMANHERRNTANIFLNASNNIFAGEGRKYFAGIAIGDIGAFEYMYQGTMLF